MRKVGKTPGGTRTAGEARRRLVTAKQVHINGHDHRDGRVESRYVRTSTTIYSQMIIKELLPPFANKSTFFFFRSQTFLNLTKKFIKNNNIFNIKLLYY